MPAAAARRLPGFRFEAQPPPLTDVLPRMDVAVLIGFAASGPINIPVAVEDEGHFASIFGDDAPLAWDMARGEMLYAYLAPAVRAFFRNGGVRCWVIRVAGGARYNQFAVPGLVQLTADGRIEPAYVRARSEGSWSDQLEAGASLNGVAAAVLWYSLQGVEFIVAPPATGTIGLGDLVRLSFPDGNYVAFFEVKSVEALGSDASPPLTSLGTQPGSRSRGPVLRVTGGAGGQAFWFATQPPSGAPMGVIKGTATMFTSIGKGRDAPVSRLALGKDRSYQATLALSPTDAPPPGSMLRISDAGAELWLTVQEIAIRTGDGSPPASSIIVQGAGIWRLKSPPGKLPSSAPQFEVLTLDLWARQQGPYPVHLDDLGFVPAHSRFWGALPTDAELYKSPNPGSENAYQQLWAAAASPQRFPIAGGRDRDRICLPISMTLAPQQFAAAEPGTLTALERDGLAEFGAGLFIDRDMAGVGLRDLISQADFLRYQSPSPRDLTGMHAALSIEEATIIAVPDAVHRGWTRFQQTPILDPPKPPEGGLGRGTDQPGFFACDTKAIAAPVLFKTQSPAGSGTYSLSWSTRDGAAYTVEQASSADFSGAAVIYRGPLTRLSLYGMPQGDFYYRVRAVAGGATSDWSNGVAVSVAPAVAWTVNPAESYSPGELISVQRAMLRMCAARGDIFGVLTAPEHYRDDGILEHVAAVRSPVGPALRFKSLGASAGILLNSAPIGAGEASAFSYAAIYHPWLIGQDENQPGVLRGIPPDGAAAGVMAKRSLARGAWIAPANELLPGVIELTPPVRRESWLSLQQAQVNLVRQEPRGFVWMSADTLTDDPDLRPINVRRLLMLLRRLALRLGATYVFEPNDDSFRRMVQRGFEALLKQMYSRGAFAGNTPDSSYQVVTGTQVNSAQSVDQGRFIVELRVAPSLPMTFLTVRLVQSGDRSLVMEVR